MKVSQRVVKKMSESISDKQFKASELTVNAVLQKDLYKKYINHNKVILEQFPIFLEKYVKVCKFLYYDFMILEIKKGKDYIKISDEIDLENQIIKLLNQKSFKMRLWDRMNINKGVKKWWILSTILYYYPIVLKELEKECKQDMYKGIHIDDEIANALTYNFLIEDFSSIIKN